MDARRVDELGARSSTRWVSGALVLLLLAGFSLALFCGLAARRAIGQPFPSLVVDPFGAYSAVRLPSWGGDPLPLRFPDRLVAIDGEPLVARSTWTDLPADRLAQRIAQLHRQGQTTVRLSFARRGATTATVVEQPIRSLRVEEVLAFFGLYAAAGLLVLWSGVLVLLLAFHREGARAFGFWSIGTFLWLTTFFDYHATRQFVPLFSLSTVLLTIGFMWIAFAFPEQPRRWPRVVRGLLVAASSALAAAGAGLLGAPVLGLDAGGVRSAIGLVAPASCALLVIVLLVRVRGSKGRARQELLWALWSLVAIPLILAVGFLLASVDGNGHIHLLIPGIMPLIPLSVGYSLLRHNLLASTAVLVRWMIIGPVILFAVAAVLVTWLVAHSLAGDSPLATGAVMAVVFMAVSWTGYRFAVITLFPAAAEFRPTLEQLSEELASFRRQEDVKRSISQAVARWLPANDSVVLELAELSTVEHLPDAASTLLERGRPVWTLEGPWRRRLLVPMLDAGGPMAPPPARAHALPRRASGRDRRGAQAPCGALHQ
jgi:hypothetical protein